MDAKTQSAIILKGFSFFQQPLEGLHAGLQNVAARAEFLGRNEEGLFIVAFPKNYDADSDPLRNPILFLHDYTLYEGVLRQDITDQALNEKAQTHDIAYFDLVSFTALLKDHLAEHADRIANASQIHTALGQLLQKAKEALTPVELDAQINAAIAARAQKRAAHHARRH